MNDNIYQFTKYGYHVKLLRRLSPAYVRYDFVIDVGTNFFLPQVHVNEDGSCSMLLSSVTLPIHEDEFFFIEDSLKQAKFLMQDLQQNLEYYMQEADKFYENKRKRNIKNGTESLIC